jgi:hypothetical protein
VKPEHNLTDRSITMEHDVYRPGEIGDALLGASGHTWTIAALTRRANRIVLTRPTPQGPAAAIVDAGALARMVPLEAAEPLLPTGTWPSDQLAPADGPRVRSSRKAAHASGFVW